MAFTKFAWLGCAEPRCVTTAMLAIRIRNTAAMASMRPWGFRSVTANERGLGSTRKVPLNVEGRWLSNGLRLDSPRAISRSSRSRP